MITLIHGADITASRKYFQEQKELNKQHVVLDGENITLTDITQILAGGGLFEDTKHLFIEQLITKKKKSSDFKPIFSYLESMAPQHTIILWEPKEIEPATIKLFKQPQIRLFKLPQTLFQFLDSIKPGNGKLLITLFHQTIQTTEVEMVFFMLIRQFRLLIALSQPSTDQEEQIDELKRMAPWQQTKLQNQAHLFSQEQLLTIYEKLFTLEYNMKTGGLATNLISAIDFLLLEV